MKKTRRPTHASSRRAPAGKSPKSDFSWLPAIIFVGGASLLVWLIVSSFKSPGSTSAPKVSPNTATVAEADPSGAASANPENTDEIIPLPDSTRQKLLGNWQRTDADYAIEIKLVGTDGVTDARYFNPFNQRSIQVEKTTVTEKKDGPEFFMILRDEGYPGSTYTLRYDETNDLLVGIYYQAAMQQSYEVSFQRMPGK